MYSLLRHYPTNSTSILRSYIYVGLLYCYYTYLREIKRIVNDHLNIRVYQYIFLVFFTLFYIYLSFYNTLLARTSTQFWKGSCPPIVLQTSKIIYVVLSTHCKFFFKELVIILFVCIYVLCS